MEDIATTTGGTDNTTPAGGASDAWYGSFSDDLKSNDLIKGYESPEALAKNHIELNNKFTELQGQIPQAPKSLGDYKFEIPDGAQLDEPSAAEFKKFAFENKIPAEMANKLVNFQLQMNKKATERATQEFNQRLDKGRTEAEASLRKEWGNNYDSSLKLAQRVANRFLSEKTREYLNKSGFGDNPELVKAFHEIGKVLSEDVLVTGEKPAPTRPKGEHGQAIFKLDKSFPNAA